MGHLGDAMDARLRKIALDEPDIPPAILLFVVAVPVGDFRTDFSGALRKRIVVGRPEYIADRPIGKGFEESRRLPSGWGLWLLHGRCLSDPYAGIGGNAHRPGHL